MQEIHPGTAFLQDEIGEQVQHSNLRLPKELQG